MRWSNWAGMPASMNHHAPVTSAKRFRSAYWAIAGRWISTSMPLPPLSGCAQKPWTVSQALLTPTATPACDRRHFQSPYTETSVSTAAANSRLSADSPKLSVGVDEVEPS